MRMRTLAVSWCVQVDRYRPRPFRRQRQEEGRTWRGVRLQEGLRRACRPGDHHLEDHRHLEDRRLGDRPRQGDHRHLEDHHLAFRLVDRRLVGSEGRTCPLL